MPTLENVVRPYATIAGGGTRRARQSADKREAVLEWGQGGGAFDETPQPYANTSLTVVSVSDRPGNAANGDEVSRQVRATVFEWNLPPHLKFRVGSDKIASRIKITYEEVTSIKFHIPQMPFKRFGTEDLADDAADGTIDASDEEISGYKEASMTFTFKLPPAAPLIITSIFTG